MGTGLGWEGNRLVVRKTGDPLRSQCSQQHYKFSSLAKSLVKGREKFSCYAPGDSMKLLIVVMYFAFGMIIFSPDLRPLHSCNSLHKIAPAIWI